MKLAAGVSVGSLTAIAGCTNLRVKADRPSGAHPATRFELGARASAWRGIAPEYIRGERNPILRMTPGKTVDLVWENQDGKPHAVVVEDSLGSTILESEENSELGGRVTLTFEASQAMTTYLDPNYPVQMRGELLVTTY